MRNLFFIIPAILVVSGCANIEFVTIAEQEHIQAQRLYDAESLCMDYKIFAHTVEYDACMENALGIDKKSKSQDAIRAGDPIEAINSLPNTASGFSTPESICDRESYTAHTPQRATCLEYASGVTRKIIYSEDAGSP